MVKEKEILKNLYKPVWKLCEFQMKRRCTDVDEYGKYMPLALTGLAAANEFAFFCGAEDSTDLIKKYNVTAHVRSLRDIISLCAANAQYVEEAYKDEPEYLDYLKSDAGQDTLFIFLVKNKVNSLSVVVPDAAAYDFTDEKQKAEYLKLKEESDRRMEDEQIINGAIVAMRELTVSHEGYHEVDYDTDEIIADYEDFRRAFNTSMTEWHSEMNAYNKLEDVTIHGRIAIVNDFVSLFTLYAALHQDDAYFLNSLGKELNVFGVYASEEDARTAEKIDCGELPDVPMNEPKIIRL